MKHERQTQTLGDLLDLTEMQQNRIRKILEQERAGFQTVRRQLSEIREKMDAVYRNDTFDEADIRRLATRQISLSVKLLVSDARVQHRIYMVLNRDRTDLPDN